MTVSLTRKRLRPRGSGDGVAATLPSGRPRRCTDVPPAGGEEECTTPSLTPWQPAGAGRTGVKAVVVATAGSMSRIPQNPINHQDADRTSAETRASAGRLYGVTTWTPECQDRGVPDSAPCTCMTT